MSKKPKKFKKGSVVVFEPKNFNPEYWANLSESDRTKYYGRLGYGSEKPRLFVFICEINKSGHCVLMNMDTQQLESMVHIVEFRLATDEEF